ncbi:galactosidase [Klebsiella aerogenes]|nr:galactosidase [Klebsiella aerogenes]
MFDEIDKRHVPYDVIGLSMYTYWNGPISALKANMDDISKRYNKDVIVVEAAYAYTLANCDNAENSFQAKEEKDGGLSRHRAGAISLYSRSDAGRHRCSRPARQRYFYWEPTWIAVPGKYLG